MGYVDLNGLGLAPAQKLVNGVRSVFPVKATAKKLPFPAVAAAVRKIAVKSVPVSQVRTVAPTNKLLAWRPPSGVGVTTVRSAPIRTVIPALTSFAMARQMPALMREQRIQVNRAKPSIYPARPVIAPARPVIAPVVPVETVKPVYTPGGTEYKNTQVQVQAGIDPNRPESWVAPAEATGAVLSMREPVPSATMAFTPSAEEPTTAEENSTAGQSGSWLQVDPIQVNYQGDKSTGAKIAEAGFGPVLWIGLGLLALGMLTGKKKGR